MDVKPGYTKTEVGVIPEEWKVKPLPEVSWFQEGPGLRNWQFTSTGMKVINVTNLEDGVLNLERTDRHISNAEFKRMYRHFAVDADDIVMASSGNSYSKTAVVRIQDLPLVMNTSVIRFKPLKETDYGFLWALLNSPLFKSQIDLMITGGAQPNFGPYHLRRINFPIPSRPEQCAIASALSDADALIESLEQLIAKKRLIKQGAMQELLTGKRRLPGFETKPGYKQTEVGVIPEDWDVTTVGSEFSIQLGKMLDSEKNVGVPKPYLGNRAVQWGRIDLTEIGEIRLRPSDLLRFRLRNGDLLVCEGGEVGRTAVWTAPIEECYYQKALHRLRPKRGYNVELVRNLLNSQADRGFLQNFVTQTSIAHLPKDKFEVVPIPAPPKAEQTAIATILTDMDAEITALETKLTKARQIKQGMMQELLTGRIRLV